MLLLIILSAATVLLVGVRLVVLPRKRRFSRPWTPAPPAVPPSAQVPSSAPGTRAGRARNAPFTAKTSDIGGRSIEPSRSAGVVREPYVPGLQIGRQLGHGGQAAVYEVLGDERMVYKKYFVPRRDIAAVRDVIESGPRVRKRLAGRGVDLMWPARIIERDGVVQGIVMPRVPERYSVNFAGPARGGRLLLTLDHAVPRPSAVYRVADVSDEDRLAIVVLVAHFLEALHHEDLVYGDLSWRNFLFSLSPSCGVLALDLDGVSRIGTRAVSAHTPDWTDPHSTSSGLVDSFDLDRYKFALLAHRMLLAKSLDARLPGVVGDEPIVGLSPTGGRAVRWLLGRASGGAGSRPQIAEWIAALEDSEPDRSLIAIGG